MSKVIVQIADAGTGKTYQLGLKAQEAMEQYGPHKVIACSLSRTGAKQVGRELELPYDQYATVHGFAHRALGSPELAEGHIDEWNALYPAWELSGGKKTANDAYDTAGTAKAGDRLKSQPEADARFTAAWQDWKKQCGYLDFPDVLVQAIENTDCAPGDPAKILVDEAQDTPLLALKLLFHWAKRAQGLDLFGDPKQSIFNFLGADALLLQKIWKKYDPDRLPLPQSYRLSQAVYAYARQWQTRFTTTMQGDFLPTAVEGFVRHAPALSQWTASKLQALFDQHEGKTIMFLATCGYMLDALIYQLRIAGIPYHNPIRINNGKWQALPQGRKGSNTVVDNVLAFSRPSEAIWGEQARFWTAQELKAWTAKLPAKGVLSLGGVKGIKALPDTASDEEIAQSFFQWFTPEAIAHIVPKPDVTWYMDQVKGSDNLRDFVQTVIRAHGVPKLKEKPRAIIGSVHSLKGHEADIVCISPDISTEAWTQARQDPASREEMIRVFYTGLTRAKEGLYLCAQDSRTAVHW
jgi:superfamily I DNA/RNA helicase